MLSGRNMLAHSLVRGKLREFLARYHDNSRELPGYLAKNSRNFPRNQRMGKHIPPPTAYSAPRHVLLGNVFWGTDGAASGQRVIDLYKCCDLTIQSLRIRDP